MKWIFFDLGATLVDERECYKSRCEYASRQLQTTAKAFYDKNGWETGEYDFYTFYYGQV